MKVFCLVLVCVAGVAQAGFLGATGGGLGVATSGVPAVTSVVGGPIASPAIYAGYGASAVRTVGVPVLNGGYSGAVLNGGYSGAVLNGGYSGAVLNGGYVAPAVQSVYAAPAVQSVYAAPAVRAVYAAPAVQSVYSAPAVQSVYAAPAIQSSYAGGLAVQGVPAVQTGYASSAIHGLQSSVNYGLGHTKYISGFVKK